MPMIYPAKPKKSKKNALCSKAEDVLGLRNITLENDLTFERKRQSRIIYKDGCQTLIFVFKNVFFSMQYILTAASPPS